MMKASVFIAYILLLMYFVVGVAFIYLFVLLVRALKKYIKSEPVRKEKAESAKSLGEVIKRYRTQRKMTQEFVAESLGVSRQAVSKWESAVCFGQKDTQTREHDNIFHASLCLYDSRAALRTAQRKTGIFNSCPDNNGDRFCIYCNLRPHKTKKCGKMQRKSLILQKKCIFI